MSVEDRLYGFNEREDLMGVVMELQLADISDERREQLLRAWTERVGWTYEDWMMVVVTGPPVSGDPAGEVEVSVG